MFPCKLIGLFLLFMAILETNCFQVPKFTLRGEVGEGVSFYTHCYEAGV